MAILKDKQEIGNYTVQSFIKEGQYNESYRVQNSQGVPFFLKIYDPQKVPGEILSSDSIITEINYCEKISHPNVISYVEKGVIHQVGNDFPYLVTKFINGSLVADPLGKGRIFPLEMSLNIIKYALEGLKHIHSLGLVHNDITPRNIMYYPKDLSATALIDLGHVSEPCQGTLHFETTDLTPFFRAPETYDSVFDCRSDIYSIAAVLYAMLFGKAPWYSELKDGDVLDSEKMNNAMTERLTFVGGLDNCPEWLSSTLKLCLSADPDARIQSADALLDALEQRQCPRVENALVKTEHSQVKTKVKNGHYGLDKKKGNGFADVAGMDDVKAMLQQQVLFVLKNPEKAQKYKLTPPNGMLLYGPPGCGKTFFAEKFAEEASLNYIIIKGSDVGSFSCYFSCT